MFLKEPGYAETNWHSDLRMAPLDANDFVTAWIPLRPVGGAEGDSGLLFAEGSHRDFALPFWHDLKGRDLGDRRYPLQDAGVQGACRKDPFRIPWFRIAGVVLLSLDCCKMQVGSA